MESAQDVVVELALEDGALLTLHLSGVQRVSTRFEATWEQAMTVGLAARDEPDGTYRTVARLAVPDLLSYLLEQLPGVEFTSSRAHPPSPTNNCSCNVHRGQP